MRTRWRNALIAAAAVPAMQLLCGALLPAEAVEDAGALAAADNTLVLVSAALVLLMTPGLAFFYGGFVQGRNVLNTMAMSFVMMGIATLVWASFGFSLAFANGGTLQPWIGNPFSYALLENIPAAWQPLAIPGLSFALFQGMFAIITPALISGALVERISFRFWCLFTPVWLLLVYAPLAHMVWGGGLLGKDLDFAGGTVVHISSGVTALMLAALLGARRGWPQSMRPPHDVTQILWGLACSGSVGLASMAAASSRWRVPNCPSPPPMCLRRREWWLGHCWRPSAMAANPPWWGWPPAQWLAWWGLHQLLAL